MYSTPSNQLLRTTAPAPGRTAAQTRSPGATAAKSPPPIPALPRPLAATLINLVRTFPHQAPHTSCLHPTPHPAPLPALPPQTQTNLFHSRVPGNSATLRQRRQPCHRRPRGDLLRNLRRQRLALRLEQLGVVGLKLRLDDPDVADNRGTSRRAMGRRVAVRAEQRAVGPVDQLGRLDERGLDQVVGHQRVSRLDVDRVDRWAVEHRCAVDDVDRLCGEHDGHERGDHHG